MTNYHLGDVQRSSNATNSRQNCIKKAYRIVSANDIERKEENRNASRLKTTSSGPLSLLSRHRRSSFIAFADRATRDDVRERGSLSLSLSLSLCTQILCCVYVHVYTGIQCTARRLMADPLANFKLISVTKRMSECANRNSNSLVNFGDLLISSFL